jgi:hypothetical protein
MLRSAVDTRYRRHNVFANSFLALYIMISMGQLNVEVLKETSERPSSEQDSHDLWVLLPEIHEMMRVESTKWHIGTPRQHASHRQ